MSSSYRPGTTVTAQIADDLRQRIVSGDLAPGAPLPSEQQLVAHYAASRGTVRRALGLLVAEGIVSSRSGRGHYVRDRVRHRFAAMESSRGTGAQDPWRTWVETELGQRGDARIEISVGAPPAHVAAAFGTGDEDVVVRRRIRTVDDKPWMVSTGYYPMSIADGTPLANARDAQPGVLAVLRDLGHEPVRHLDEIRARMPSPVEAALLGLEAGVPVIEQTRLSWDPAGVPCRATLNAFPADRIVLTYDLNEPGI